MEKWSFAVSLVRGGIAQLALFVPISAVLVNIAENLRQVAALSIGHELLLTFERHVAVSMVGGIIVALGLVVYALFCPLPVRLSVSRGDYARSTIESGDLEELRRAYQGLSRKLNQSPAWARLSSIPPDVVSRGMEILKDEDTRYGVLVGQSNERAALPILGLHFDLLDVRGGPLPTLCSMLLIAGAVVALLPAGVLVWDVLTTARIMTTAGS